MMDTKLLEEALLEGNKESYKKGVTAFASALIEAVEKMDRPEANMTLEQVITFLKVSMCDFLIIVDSPNLQENNNG